MFGTREAPIAAAVPWPEKPEDCHGSIGARRQALARARDALGHVNGLARQYRDELAEHERTVRHAQPGDDLVHVAAAAQGVLIYQRAVAELGPRCDHADGDYRAIEIALAREFSRVQKLRRMLTGQEPMREDGFSREPEHLRSELVQLIGYLPG